MATVDTNKLISAALAKRLRDLREDLHRHPELSWQEKETSNRLHAALAALNPKSLQRVATTGLVARIAGRDPNAPVVALRGDIDALPIQEDTGLPYASANAGVMHACGHDVHATWTVGAAALLAEQPATGDVLVVFQPAEEIGEGAVAILQSGALEDARVIFGAHVDRRFAVGQVVAEAGPLAASADSFEIKLAGRGAHGARPHEGRDPIVCAAAIITALQTIVARRLNPATAGVVTIGSIHAGTAPNVIPGEAVLQGTLRALDPDTRALLHEEVRRIASNVAAAHDLTAEVRALSDTPPIVNPPEPAGWARMAVEHVLGPEAIVPLGTLNMGGEDFAFYMERMPGCFLRIGAREPGTQPIPAHTPKFYAAQEAVHVGAAVLAECARVASAALRD